MENSKYAQLIKQTQEKIDQNKEKRKQELLEKHHLYDEVYGEKSDEYPLSILKENELLYYKKVYEDISLEALEALEDLIETSKVLEKQEKKPIPFEAPAVVGYIYIILSIVIGLFLLAEYSFVGLAVMAAGIVTGIAFLTAGHMVRQLNIIIHHLSKDEHQSN